MEVCGFDKRTARKQHCCSLCGGPIDKGEKYVRWVTIDGGVTESKLHTDCYDILDDYCNDTKEEEWSDDYVFDWVNEELTNIGIEIPYKPKEWYKELKQSYLNNILKKNTDTKEG